MKLYLKINVADLDCEEDIIRISDDAEVEKDTNLRVNGLGVRALALVELRAHKVSACFKHINGNDHPLLDTESSFIRYMTSAREVYDDPNMRLLH